MYVVGVVRVGSAIGERIGDVGTIADVGCTGIIVDLSYAVGRGFVAAVSGRMEDLPQ
jgi:hypothetical protein